MTGTNIVAARAHNAHEAVLRFLQERAPGEGVEFLANSITVPVAVPKNPYHLLAFQAQVFASLVEIIREQDRRISVLEGAAPAAATAADPDGETADADGDGRPVPSEKLRELLGEELCGLLLNAGYADAQAVRDASDEDLLAIKGVGTAKLEQIRAAIDNEGV